MSNSTIEHRSPNYENFISLEYSFEFLEREK